MIDTIKLELQQSMYTILDHTKFTPSTCKMFGCGPYNKGTVSFSKQNPNATDRKSGRYKPRLSITRRPLKNIGYHNTLYIEFSIPKLVFGNNFDELTNDDFDKVKSTLISTLKMMGIHAYESQIHKAKVSSIHYGKNIILDDYTTPYTYIKELQKVDISKINDSNRTDYRNGGLSYKYHTNTFEFTFYDKLKDLEQSKFSEKRAIDKDDYCQLGLFDSIMNQKDRNNPFQVLRLELRLNTRLRIKQTFKKLKLSDNMTFEKLFDQDLSQYLLLSFFSELLNKYIPTFESKSSADTFELLQINNPNIKNMKLLELATAHDIVHTRGIAEFRNMIDNSTWYRIKKVLKSLIIPSNTNYLQTIKSNLENFTPVHLVDYPQIVLNNVN